MSSLPPFTADGVLPPGDYVMTIEALRESPLVRGPGDGSLWDVDWRRTLVDNLAIVVGHLLRVGIEEIFVNGSFVESKPHPNDIDGYFVCDRTFLYSGELELRLQRIDPVWTWDSMRRYPVQPGMKSQLPMWHKYRVELFPHVGQFTGIRDSTGNDLLFPGAFRQTRDHLPKGIVKIGAHS